MPPNGKRAATPGSATYHAWLELGARKYRGWAIAYGEVLPSGDAVYPCPLCTTRRLFSTADLDAGILSAEDVPPRSVNGRKILLTCQPCNTSQGGRIDTHNRPREQFLDSLSGTRVWPVRGEATVGGVTARGEVYSGPGSRGFAYVEAMNNLHEREAFERAIRDPANVGEIRMTPRFRWGQADLSVIRAAYLASFALFGWAHVFREAYVPLRQRLASATAPDLPPIVGAQRAGLAAPNKLLLVAGPQPFEGLLFVRITRWLVAFPGPYDGRTLDEVATVAASMPDAVNGREFEWPTRPEHWCDPDPPTEESEA